METGDDKKPDLKIVSTKSSDEIEAKRILDEARRSVKFTREDAAQYLHRLTANLLRVIAGAGEPDRLLMDIDEARTAYLKHVQALEHAKTYGTMVPIKFMGDLGSTNCSRKTSGSHKRKRNGEGGKPRRTTPIPNMKCTMKW